MNNESVSFGPGGYPPPPGGYGPPPGGYGPPPGGYGGPPPGGFGGYGGPPPGFGPPPMGPMGPMGGMPTQNGLGIAALVCGILSIFFNCLCCSGLGIPLGIAAAIMGGIQMSRVNSQPTIYGGKGLAMGGLICGIFGLLFGVVMFFLGFGMQMLSAMNNN